jgi:hypothetical protein
MHTWRILEMNKQQLTFLSYSRIDQDFALKLARELKSSGFNVWLDQMDIPKGSRWDDEVEKALKNCDIFMVILTPASSQSHNVKDEIGYALDSHKRILPVLLKKSDIPFRLRRLQYVDFTTRDFQEGVEDARQLLGTFVGDPPPPPPPPENLITKLINKLRENPIPSIVIGLCIILAVAYFGVQDASQKANASEPTLTPSLTPSETIAATETERPPESVPVMDTPSPTPTDTPTPSPTPVTPYVVITDIRLENNLYVVDYEVHNFPHSPQLHVHMFFDTVSPENAGMPGTGPWKLTWGPYGNPPFTQYGTSNQPSGATQMCSLVANPDHTIQPNTGNCVDLSSSP